MMMDSIGRSLEDIKGRDASTPDILNPTFAKVGGCPRASIRPLTCVVAYDL